MIVTAPFNPLQRHAGLAAWARLRTPHQNIIQPITHDRLRTAGKIGDQRGKALLIDPLRFHVNKLFVQMQGAVATGGSQKTFGGLIDFAHVGKYPL
ncbi:hypothetical protein D3C78_1682550 [compost metagenome]